jgi:hypothetical protein
MTETTDSAGLLYGTDKIASFLNISRKAAEHLVVRKKIPTFRIGRTVCARQSTLVAALERLEQEPLPAA